MLALLAGCGQRFSYQLVDPREHPEISVDSLRWSYVGEAVSELPVIAQNGSLMRLRVDSSTQLFVRTTEGVEYVFRLRTVSVIDGGAGLLGGNTMWRGYDTRQSAMRSVYVREIASSYIWSRHPAHAHITSQ